MRLRAFVVLGAAFALALVSAYLARSWIAEQSARTGTASVSASAQMPLTRIVVADGPLPYGSKILRRDIRLADWPAESVPKGAFTDLNEVAGISAEDADGRVALRSMAPDEPILKSKISGFGARASLSALIAPGQRAATIRVNDINGVAGFVLPGDRVDVLLTRDAGEAAGRRNPVTDILLQNMKVLGIDQDANAERAQPAVVRAVTLEVTQPQAQKLTLAQNLGTLALTLRHADAADAVMPRTVTARDLPLAMLPPTGAAYKLPPPHKPPAAAAPAPGRSIRIVRGLDASVYQVDMEPSVHADSDRRSLANMPYRLYCHHSRKENVLVQLPANKAVVHRRSMVKRPPSSNIGNREQIEYIADMLVQLDRMAQSCGQWKLSRLIGAAARAAAETKKNLPPTAPGKRS